MDIMASQITDNSHVCSTVCTDAHQRKHQSSASLAFVRGIHRSPMDSPHKGPVTRKMFPFDDVTMYMYVCNGADWSLSKTLDWLIMIIILLCRIWGRGWVKRDELYTNMKKYFCYLLWHCMYNKNLSTYLENIYPFTILVNTGFLPPNFPYNMPKRRVSLVIPNEKCACLLRKPGWHRKTTYRQTSNIKRNLSRR